MRCHSRGGCRPGLPDASGEASQGPADAVTYIMEDRRANCPTGQSARASYTAPRRYEPHYSQPPASVKSVPRSLGGPCRRGITSRCLCTATLANGVAA